MSSWLASGVCAAVFAAAFLALSAPATGATVTQTRSFDHSGGLTTSAWKYGIAKPDTFDLHFDAFDAGLGPLLSATWTLSSTQHYEVGSSQIGGDLSFL